MTEYNINDYELVKTEGVFTLKNLNTTVGFIRFNEKGEVEYIFVNPIYLCFFYVFDKITIK